MNNLKPGSIWMVKSFNEYEEYYAGMSCGNSRILIISVFKDNNDTTKFTYVKLYKFKKKESKCNYININLKDTNFYIDIDNYYLGDVQALDYFIYNINEDQFKLIIHLIEKTLNITINKSNIYKNEKTTKINENIHQETIHKFGIDIYVTENEDVKLTKNKKLILSQKAKDDIIYNSKTLEDIRILCDKYQIYPIKAIKEIRNRLVYQHKQIQG